MNREIKFRGKRADNGDWVIGSLVMVCDGESLRRYPCIVISFNHDVFDWYEVIPETIGQFTGLADKNGKEIFEGDKFDDGDNDGSYYLIEWNNELSKFSVNLYSYAMQINEGGGEEFDNKVSLVDSNIVDVKDLCDEFIIGNIHDNPELK